MTIMAQLFISAKEAGQNERKSMPNIKSAEKRVRQTVKTTANNKVKKSRISSSRNKLADAVNSGDKDKAKEALSSFSSALDKAAKSGVIKSNKADRSKSRAVKSVAKM
jgi:small subunit ribosomal protein S20